MFSKLTCLLALLLCINLSGPINKIFKSCHTQAHPNLAKAADLIPHRTVFKAEWHCGGDRSLQVLEMG